jgi:hypothetical protein
MYANHTLNDYVIIIHIPTGKRSKLVFNKEKADKASNFAAAMDMILKIKNNEDAG